MAQRPNVLFVISDDHRHHSMGWTGGGVLTPTLDALAAQGTACTQARIMGGCSGAVCVPTRASMLTGRSPLRTEPEPTTGERGLPACHEIAPDLPTLPERLRAAGYRTHQVGKWHQDEATLRRSFDTAETVLMKGMGDHFHLPLQRLGPNGMEPIAEEGRHASERFADAAIDAMVAEDDRPFCCWLAFTAPHDPRTAPAHWHDRYPADAEVLPPNAYAEHPFDIGDLQIRDEKLAAWPRDPAAIRQHQADYHALIGHLDQQLGRVLQALADSGQADNTIVVYTADHGLAVGRHGLMGKQNVYDHSLRVPAILRGPGVPVGRRITAPVHSCDLQPTLLELCGLEADPGEARSLLPLLHDPDATPARTYTVSIYRDQLAAVYEQRWCLLRSMHSPLTGRGEERVQLYDLERDPWQLDDRSADPALADVRARLFAELDAGLHELGVPWHERAQDPARSAKMA